MKKPSVYSFNVAWDAHLFMDKHGIDGANIVRLCPHRVREKDALISLWRHPTHLLMFKRGLLLVGRIKQNFNYAE
jgi:hypothetical protein